MKRAKKIIDENLADAVYLYITQSRSPKSAASLCMIYGFKDKKDLRDYIMFIRRNPKYLKTIGSNNSGYFGCDRDNFASAQMRLQNQAVSLLKTVDIQNKKQGKNTSIELYIDGKKIV